MGRLSRLSMMPLILLVVWSYGGGSVLEGQAMEPGLSMAPAKSSLGRFSQADNGVITDHVTGLEWYVSPSPDSTWYEAKSWTEKLEVGGGGWRLPNMKELKALFQKDASPVNMDPFFQPKGAWVWSGELRNDWSAWGIAFYNGLEGWHSVNYAYGRVSLAVRPRK